MKSEKSGGGQIAEKTESQCKVSGGDTVGGLIGKTQYVNSWGDASYTACKLDGTNQGGILFGCFLTTDYNCSDVKLYYPKECYEEKGWQDTGCDLNGGGSTKNYFTNAARPKESVLMSCQLLTVLFIKTEKFAVL